MPDPQHHPQDALLLRYASGGAPAPLALVLATHVAICTTCQATVRRLEALGGSLLCEIAPEPVSDGLLTATLARLDRAVPAPKPMRMPVCGIELPAPLRAVVDRPIDQLPWRRYGRTVSETVLIPEEGGFVASLLRVAPGAAIPTHTHRGIEVTLLLAGAFADRDLVLRPGDFVVTDEAVTHRPIALPEGECLCLVATEAPPRFKGLLGPVLNYISRR